jgi:hypothetical protein
LIPFSSFVERVALATTGFKLNVTEAGDPISAERVAALPLSRERLFVAHHEISLYTSEASLCKGIISYENTCAYKNIRNYVLVSLAAHPTFRAKEISGIQAAQRAMGLPEHAKAELEKVITEHSHMLYFAPLTMDNEASLEFIEKELKEEDEDRLQEFVSYLDGIENAETRLAEILEMLLEIEPHPHRDYLEMGYPAKFIKILDDEQWIIQAIRRYGTIENNVLLADSTIISELRGEQGVTRQKYSKEIYGSDPRELSHVKTEISQCLQDNPIWRSHISTCINELKVSNFHGKIKISIFNPGNIILSIFNYIARSDGVRYIPSYRIINEGEGPTQIIFGVLEANGKSPSMTQIVSSYFDNDPSELLTSLSWGGYERRDAKIMRDIGLTYATYKIHQKDGKDIFWKLTELGWEPSTPIIPYEGLNSFIDYHKAFISDIYDFFSAHWNGFMTSYHRDEEISFRT